MKAIFGALLFSLFLALLAPSPPVRGCATAARKGEPVRIASESALIVWDEKTRTQHFIRRASFQTRVPYFGFLVPTPTRPRLAETPDEVFQKLEAWTKPEVEMKERHEPIGIGCSDEKRESSAPGSSVEVLERQRVAGFDAVVLKATDGKGLREWLDKHGYDARPKLTDWVAPYVKQGWIITAFQIAKTDREEDRLSTKAVCMSFTADRPFFPYREPVEEADAKSGRTRLLRVFGVSGQRMQGTLGEANAAWQGKAVWANPLNKEQHESLTKLLDQQEVRVSAGTWLTVFDDHSTPRSDDGDLFFSPAKDQSTLKRPPIIRYETLYVPGRVEFCCLITFAAPFVLLFLVWRWMRWKNAA